MFIAGGEDRGPVPALSRGQTGTPFLVRCSVLPCRRASSLGVPSYVPTLRSGRRHQLEFLRNLTPQVLLLSTALVLFVLWKRAEDGVWYLMLFVGTTLLFLLAVRANIENFLDNGFSSSAYIATERDRLKGAEVHGARRIRGILRYIWQERRKTFVELVWVLAVVYGAIVSILLTAVVTASRAVG